MVNVLGAAAMGVLLGILAARQSHRLWRPFIGAGFLGGFTTVSAFALEAQQLLAGGYVSVALSYLVLTPIATVAAFAFGSGLVRLVLRNGDSA